MNTGTSLTDQEIMDDILSSQKHITGVYNAFSNECVCKKLQSDMMDILDDEHEMQFDVFGEMQKRGWYSPEAAQQDKINQTKFKFEGIANTL